MRYNNIKHISNPQFNIYNQDSVVQRQKKKDHKKIKYCSALISHDHDQPMRIIRYVKVKTKKKNKNEIIFGNIYSLLKTSFTVILAQ